MFKIWVQQKDRLIIHLNKKVFLKQQLNAYFTHATGKIIIPKGYSPKCTKRKIQIIPLQQNLHVITVLKQLLFNLSLTRRGLFLPAKNLL